MANPHHLPITGRGVGGDTPLVEIRQVAAAPGPQHRPPHLEYEASIERTGIARILRVVSKLDREKRFENRGIPEALDGNQPGRRLVGHQRLDPRIAKALSPVAGLRGRHGG